MVSAANLLRDILTQETDRDKQVKIGASQFASPCTYCVAKALSGDTKERGYYWLGGVLGTAGHDYIERRTPGIVESAMLEEKIVLGELPGYGTINSRLDFYDPTESWVIDWKSTSRDKAKLLRIAHKTEPGIGELPGLVQARFTLTKYIGQVQSYARGLELAGYAVKHVSLGFFNRDGKTSEDIWSIDLQYNREYANVVWTRLERLWDYVREGKDISELESYPGCYDCEKEGRL